MSSSYLSVSALFFMLLSIVKKPKLFTFPHLRMFTLYVSRAAAPKGAMSVVSSFYAWLEAQSPGYNPPRPF